jgi:hypothetical protein
VVVLAHQLHQVPTAAQTLVAVAVAAMMWGHHSKAATAAAAS